MLVKKSRRFYYEQWRTIVHKVHRMILISVFGLEGVGHYIEGRLFGSTCHSSFMALDDY